MPGGNRDLMERLLTPTERRVLATHCTAAGVPLDRWHLTGLARGWELVAFERLVRRIRATERVTLSRAEWSAAARLGISRETLLSRRKDSARAAYRKAS
jgi:hypothetical protein